MAENFAVTGRQTQLGFVSAHPVFEKKLWKTINYARKCSFLGEFILSFTKPDHPLFTQILMDCSVIPQVIAFEQEHGQEALIQGYQDMVLLSSP